MDVFLQVRNLFLKTKYKNEDVGVDGLILDVMRSRDSGTAPFISYYKICGDNREIKSWNDLKPDFEEDHFNLLQTMYGDGKDTFKDIDLMIGILLERRCRNLMGKIGGCLVAEQFRRFKFGDRFFYTHSNNPKKIEKCMCYEI